MTDNDILDALAAHIDALTPPAGLTLRQVYTTPPSTLAVTPSLVLMPSDDSVTYGSGNRTVTLTVNATLYLQPTTAATLWSDIYAWRAWMRGLVTGSVRLDGTAAQAVVSSTSIGTDQWSDIDFATVTAAITVTVFEAVAFTA
jgi:hypothetical protein